MTRTQAYSVVTAIVCQGRQSAIAKKYPQLVKFVTKDGYVNMTAFNKAFPPK